MRIEEMAGPIRGRDQEARGTDREAIVHVIGTGITETGTDDELLELLRTGNFFLSFLNELLNKNNKKIKKLIKKTYD